VTVAGAPLTIKTFTPPTPTEHVSFTATLVTFTDGNARPDSKDYTATINWGDGSSSTQTVANGGITGTFPVSVVGTHTYATFGNFTLSVQVVDKGGTSTSTSAVISVGQGTIRGGFGAQSIVVGSHGGGSVVDVAPALGAAGGGNAAPLLRQVAERTAPRPAPAAATAVGPALTQVQLTDLVFQMGLTGSPVGTSVHLTGAPPGSPSIEATTLPGPSQILLTFNQGMAASQNNAVVTRILRSAAAKAQQPNADDAKE
jgi:hypothetical protein